jgi:hypothetical protein
MSEESNEGRLGTWKSHGGSAEGEVLRLCHVAWAFYSASVASSPHQMYLVRRPSY